jgi:hypothetical protein
VEAFKDPGARSGGGQYLGHGATLDISGNKTMRL